MTEAYDTGDDSGDSTFYGETGDAGGADHPFTTEDYEQTVALLGGEQSTDGDDGWAGAGDDVDDAGEEVEQHGPGREAQKLRGRLRDAVADRDAATTRLEASQRGRIEDLASAALVKPAALWAAGLTIEDMQTEDGDIDPALVRAGIEYAQATLGLRRMPRPDMSQTHGTAGAPTASWDGLMKGRGNK